MITKGRKSSLWLLVTAAVVCGLLGGASLLSPVQALPPRPPTPTPTPIAAARTASTNSSINLRAHFPASWPWADLSWQDLWTVVQWQDLQGEWHDVEGWQGTLDEIATGEEGDVVGEKRWWVYEPDLGKGPFRWLVYEEADGRRIASSEPFDLPQAANQTTLVVVSLPSGQ